MVVYTRYQRAYYIQLFFYMFLAFLIIYTSCSRHCHFWYMESICNERFLSCKILHVFLSIQFILCYFTWLMEQFCYRRHPHPHLSVNQIITTILHFNNNKANLRDLIAATGLVIVLKLDSYHWFFQSVWPKNTVDDIEKQQENFSRLHQALCIISKPSMKSNWSYSPETLNSGQNWRFVSPMGPWNLTDDLENQKGTSPMLLQALCIIS